MGFWRDQDELRAKWAEADRFEPRWTPEQRDEGYARWRKAVDRSLDWIDTD